MRDFDAMRVLLVEDDAGIREGMVELLSDHGQVNAVETLGAAQAALGEDQFDLVFADLRLGNDGNAGRKVLDQAKARGVPVVIVSALTREEIIQKLGEARADAVLTKPFQLEDVEAIVAKFKRPAR